MAALAILPGCYTYHAADPATLEPGEEIRVEVGSERFAGSANAASFFGPSSFEGRFSELTDESLIVSVWVGQGFQGTPFESVRQDVEVPRDEVTLVENRQLSGRRTALASAGTLAVIAYMIHTLGLTQFTDDGEGTSPEPPAGDPTGVNLRFR